MIDCIYLSPGWSAVTNPRRDVIFELDVIADHLRHKSVQVKQQVVHYMSHTPVLQKKYKTMAREV